MRYLFFALFIGLYAQANAQSYPGLERVLKREFPSTSSQDGRWVFYPNKAYIFHIEKPLVEDALPPFNFFSVTLTNFLGYHVNQATCLILYDSAASRIQLVEPVWYGGVSEPFIKLFIGQKFSSKDSLLTFFQQVHELMEVGSGFKFIHTGFSNDSVTYDLGYFEGDSYTTSGNGITSTVNYNQDGVWRKIVLVLDNLKLIQYTSINPATDRPLSRLLPLLATYRMPFIQSRRFDT